jgi:hypothetical protein
MENPKNQPEQPETTSQLEPGLYFSPGFYMGFWERSVLKQFPQEVSLKNTRFQKHREMFTGALIAAALTRSSGMKHYVGLPETEPPDVDVVYLKETEYNGKPSQELVHIPIEVTRCNLAEGESLLGQILGKNRIGYKENWLCVHIQGGGTLSAAEQEQVFQHLKTIEFYPAVVTALMKVVGTESILFPGETYALMWLYPRKGHLLVSLTDKEVVFRGDPDVFRKIGRKTGRELEDLGKFMLIPPPLDYAE